MQVRLIVITLLGMFLLSCTQDVQSDVPEKAMIEKHTTTAQPTDTGLACTLTTPELEKRKAKVISELQTAIIERKELTEGYAFKFAGDDATLDKLSEFIKAERSCCSFFRFTLRVEGNGGNTWMDITGPQ